MASDTLNWDFRPRRADARLRLGIEAEFVTVHGQYRDTLMNLSETGARVLFVSSEKVSDGVLKWMGFEAFCSTVWRADGNLGLCFEKPIDPAWLLETRMSVILTPNYATDELRVGGDFSPK